MQTTVKFKREENNVRYEHQGGETHGGCSQRGGLEDSFLENLTSLNKVRCMALKISTSKCLTGVCQLATGMFRLTLYNNIIPGSQVEDWH